MENPRKKSSNNVAPMELGVFLGSLCYHNVASPMLKNFLFLTKKLLHVLQNFLAPLGAAVW